MLKHSIRWMIPLVVLLVLVVAFVAVPSISSHAATITVHPDFLWTGQ
jgi:hypothetical protein